MEDNNVTLISTSGTETCDTTSCLTVSHPWNIGTSTTAYIYTTPKVQIDALDSGFLVTVNGKRAAATTINQVMKLVEQALTPPEKK